MKLSFVMVTIPLLIIPFGTRSLTTLHLESNMVTVRSWWNGYP